MAERVAPIDEAEQVGRDAQGHGRMGEGGLEILVKTLGNQRAERFTKLARVGDSVSVLESVSSKIFLADFRVSGDAAPELVAAESAMVGEHPTRRFLRSGGRWGVDVSGIVIHRGSVDGQLDGHSRAPRRAGVLLLPEKRVCRRRRQLAGFLNEHSLFRPTTKEVTHGESL